MNFKNEKGSITVYVLVAVFFLIAIIAGRFIVANRNLKVQYDALAKVKAVYESGDKKYLVGNGIGNGTADSEEPVDHEIYIFNGDAFNFFNDPSSNEGRFYVYQSDIWYISGKSATNDREISLEDTKNYNFKYKLMSDITVNSSDTSEDNRKDVAESTVCRNLDFNNHIIYTNKTPGMENYVFWNGKKADIGQESE